MILDRLEKIERNLESTEQSTKACNVKFINIEELEREDDRTTTQYITDVLNAHAPTPNWRQEDISRAYRVGRPHPRRSEPRPIIVHFCRWSDKMAVLGDRMFRDTLRESGVKVSSDLTTHQRETVEFHRGQGKVAYIHHGKLHVRDSQPSEQSDDRQRRYRSDPPQEEDWPTASDSRRQRHSRPAEPWLLDRQQVGENYGHQYRDQGNRLRSNQSRSFGRSTQGDHDSSFHQRMAHQQQRTAGEMSRGLSAINQHTARSKDQHGTRRNAHQQNNTLTGAVPIVPGIHSYSEVVRQDGQGESVQRTVFLKDVPKRPPAISGEHSRSADNLQQNKEQMVNSPLGQGKNDDDRQDKHDENGVYRTDNIDLSSTDMTKQRTRNDGEDKSDDKEDDKPDREVSDYHAVTDDDITANTEATREPKAVIEATANISVSVNEEEDVADSTDNKTGRLTDVDSNEAGSSPDRLDTRRRTNTDEQTNTRATNNMTKHTIQQSRQSPSSAQVLRPRRTVSQASSSGQSSHKTSARSGSQSSIADAFKKAHSGDSVEGKDLTPQAKVNAKSSGASGARK
eukprot:TRINITY_DN43182_c0_g1_i1.p1 TRINITY_DN43182_c0_g1~~TRINITY_DN43182_c0_g1_i1.p1  ORF type:complete len:567 (+),score=131.05 TRINITY_DN43182_c0_g1_i1:140-1840(+)